MLERVNYIPYYTYFLFYKFFVLGNIFHIILVNNTLKDELVHFYNVSKLLDLSVILVFTEAFMLSVATFTQIVGQCKHPNMFTFISNTILSCLSYIFIVSTLTVVCTSTKLCDFSKLLLYPLSYLMIVALTSLFILRCYNFISRCCCDNIDIVTIFCRPVAQHLLM